MPVDTILHNAKIATNTTPSFVEALAITGGKIAGTGMEREVFRLRGPATKVIDGKGRTLIPGLNDSHMHPIRGGLNYNMELRWDGVPSLAFSLSRRRATRKLTHAHGTMQNVPTGMEQLNSAPLARQRACRLS